MSGSPAETEREHELRAFASRLLEWPDPEGASTVDLMPGGYPELIPLELVDTSEHRFLGSAVRRRGEDVLNVELLLEAGASANEALESYERRLITAGWQRVNQPGLRHGGFEGSGFPLSSVLVNARQRNRVYVQSFLRHDGSMLRVMYHLPTAEPLPDDLSPDAPPGRSPLPALQPPPGVRMRSDGSGGGGGRWSSYARAKTEMAPMELESLFARQVEAAGWGRLSGSADESFAWSSWLKPSAPPAREWRGILLVLAAFPGERSLSFSCQATDS